MNLCSDSAVSLIKWRKVSPKQLLFFGPLALMHIMLEFLKILLFQKFSEMIKKPRFFCREQWLVSTFSSFL